MILTYAPPVLGSGIDKNRPDYGVYCGVASGVWSHLPDPRQSRQSALVLVNDRQRPDDALRPGGDPREASEIRSDRIAIFAPRICSVA
jgi:hypothetical protein